MSSLCDKLRILGIKRTGNDRVYTLLLLQDKARFG
jgi:hypothetical protein